MEHIIFVNNHESSYSDDAFKMNFIQNENNIHTDWAKIEYFTIEHNTLINNKVMLYLLSILLEWVE
jgi:hypothetical protein